MRRSLCHVAASVLALGLFLALPSFAADGVIRRGIDPWVTQGNGTTYNDFFKDPLPAGFFCSRSEPFTGRIVFRGIPVATDAPGALRTTDTLVERLDDARFNRLGVASTRIKVRAMNFEGVAPIQTACGAYNVRVGLDGDQPTTHMKIFRENEQGGRFLAPISVNIKMTFTPVSGSGRSLEIAQQLRFPADPRATWASKGRGAPEHSSAIQVDTDGDQILDTVLPGTSNFAAGWPALAKPSGQNKECYEQCPELCHLVETHEHCTYVPCELC